MMRHVAWLLAAGAMLWADPAAAQGKKSRLSPGLDPGGMAIAILSTGIDYTSADIAQRLARDGEGELIGWDFVDADNRPLNTGSADTPAAWGGDGTALVAAIGRTGRRVVPVRIDSRDAMSLAKAVAFIARTPARVVVVPMWTRDAADWAAFGMAIKAFPDLLFIVAAGDEGKDIDREPVWPAAFGHANVLVVTAPAIPGGDPSTRPNIGQNTVAAIVEGRGEALRAPDSSRLAAAYAADALAGCWPQLPQRFKGEALKKALLAEAARTPPGLDKPVIERCGEGAAALPQR